MHSDNGFLILLLVPLPLPRVSVEDWRKMVVNQPQVLHKLLLTLWKSVWQFPLQSSALCAAPQRKMGPSEAACHREKWKGSIPWIHSIHRSLDPSLEETGCSFDFTSFNYKAASSNLSFVLALQYISWTGRQVQRVAVFWPAEELGLSPVAPQRQNEIFQYKLFWESKGSLCQIQAQAAERSLRTWAIHFL